MSEQPKPEYVYAFSPDLATAISAAVREWNDARLRENDAWIARLDGRGSRDENLTTERMQRERGEAAYLRLEALLYGPRPADPPTP